MKVYSNGSTQLRDDVLVELRLALVLLDDIEALGLAVPRKVFVETLLTDRLRGSVVCGRLGLQGLAVLGLAAARTEALLNGLVLPGLAPGGHALDVQQPVAIRRGDVGKVRLLGQRLLEDRQIPVVNATWPSVGAEGKRDLQLKSALIRQHYPGNGSWTGLVRVLALVWRPINQPCSGV